MEFILKGYLHNISIQDILPFQAPLLKNIYPTLFNIIPDEKVISPTTQTIFVQFMDKFNSDFLATKVTP